MSSEDEGLRGRETIEKLMDKCDIAGFGEWYMCGATATNGWWRQSQYDAAVAFVLAP
jgi:hypothetical protein